MVRLARVAVPECPHHVTQRGSRRQEMFFCEEDYAAYPSLMAEWCGECGVDLWAYCLMGSHVHLVAVPSTAEGLARGIGEAHGRYTRRINFRPGSDSFIARLDKLLARRLRPGKPGRPRKGKKIKEHTAP